ncbi:hypothetical protein [Nocardia sp. NPDC052566]|uniref:hypothetical protein n=1 Tax=Nocardia sp. NPDC052566 TaxID=3364330 RepID=UPI0037CA7C4A
MIACQTTDDKVFRVLPARLGPTDLERDVAEEIEAPPVISTHRVTYSDRLKVFIGPAEAVHNFLRPLRRLDGHDRYSVCMTRLPAPMHARDIPASVSAERGSDYLHCMGSADALVIELRETVDGHTRQAVVGRKSVTDRDNSYDAAAELLISIQRGLRELVVHPDEVFTAEEAADIFAAYYRTGEVPDDLHLRERAVQ